jgi:hypothetical protein
MYEKTFIKGSDLSLEEELSSIKMNGSVNQIFLENLGPNEVVLGELNDDEKRLVLWSFKKNQEVIGIRQLLRDKEFMFNDQLLKEMVNIAYKFHKAKDRLQQSLCRRFPGYLQFEIREGFMVVMSQKTWDEVREIKKARRLTYKSRINNINSH